ncbi:MAG: hypothetical protein ABR552_10980 [Actinomycetota bacterium]|nr:hypothetical protein [Actinomycetota bacterium]
MDAAEAALRVLSEDAGAELHWTVVWDRALRAGYVDPIAEPDARDRFIKALADAARTGGIERTSTGTYRWTGG